MLQSDKEVVKRILLDPNTFATVLYAIANRYFEEDFHSWDPITIAMEFEEEFGVVLPPENEEKINALISAITSGQFHDDWRVFDATCEILTNGYADFEYLNDDLTPAEIAWGVIEVGLADDDPQEYSTDVATYTGLILRESGFINPPSVLWFARMPERQWMGDTKGEIRAQGLAETAHAAVLNEYLEDQGRELFTQIRSLPWANDELLDELAREIRKISFLGKVSSESAPEGLVTA